MHLPDQKNKLIYWGIGIKCWKCLIAHPEIVPDAFLDSYFEEKSWKGKPVYNPTSYTDWENSFIVVTTRKEDECFEYMEALGLKRGQDYTSCPDFFNYKEMTSEEMLAHAEDRIRCNPDYLGRELIIGPIFSSRVSDELIRFFNAYVEQNQDERLLLLTGLNVITEERAEELIGFPVINISSNSSKGVVEQKKHLEILCDLLKPIKLLIWGGWTEATFFLRDLATDRGLGYAHFEHGFIPGTIQCDKEGIAGYGEIANHPDEFSKYPITLTKGIFDHIQEMITGSGKDTGVFRIIRSDQDQLSKISKNRKTVLLAGSDCIHWDVEGGSDFWKKAVSEEVDSSEDAFSKTLEITRRNGWNLIYKPHPGNPDEFCEQELGAEDVAIVRYAAIDQLIKKSDVVVTVSTAVSYKTLFYEKPLVEIGKSGFYGQGCSYEVHGDFKEKMKEAILSGVTDEQKENFVHHVLTLLSYNHWDDLTHPELPYGLPITERFMDNRRSNV